MPPTPFWAKSKFVLSVILFYLAVHFAIRMAMGPALATDDAEQALFAQHFAWSYRYRAPPLFTWLLVTLGEVIQTDFNKYPNVARWLANMKKLKTWNQVNEVFNGLVGSTKGKQFETA